MSEAARDPKAWVLLAIPLLLPFGALAEVPVLVACVWSVVSARGIAWSAPATRLAMIVFLAYWVPELLSAPDSYDARKSWQEVALDLRFLPLLLFATLALRDAARVRFVCTGVAIIVVAWCLDALLQAATGLSLGGAARADRLSGIFGDENLKLGGVVAVLAPFLLLWAWRPRAWIPAFAGMTDARRSREGASLDNDARRSREGGSPGAMRSAVPRVAVAFLLLLTVILLAGARAAWIALAVGVACVAWRRLGAKRGSLALAALLALGAIAGIAANSISPRFAERVDRTAQALRGDGAAIDYALSFRLPIWRTALAMTVAHPLNGVGVRAFREAYPAYAPADDHWLDPAHGDGALHAHQLLLEVLSETGGVGLLCWLAGVVAVLNAWRRAPAAARERAAAPAYALAAMLFPLNTHYAMYSSFWSLLLFTMLALWIAALHAPGDDT